jgi:hypothetical protein
MRIVTAARRTVAVLAATALVSTGGLVSGAFVGTASAQGALTVAPPGAPNTAITTFTLTGTSFYPSGQDTIVVKRNPTVAGQQDYTVAPDDNTAACGPSPIAVPDSDCGTTLTFKLDLTNAAPGSYDLTLTETSANPLGTSYTTQKNGAIGVATPGSPIVTSTKPYVGTGLPGQIEITGDNLTKGSTVDFLKGDPVTGAPTTVVDTGMSFLSTVDGGPAGNGNVSKTTLRGTYSYSGFTPGIHYVRVTNPVAQFGTASSTFYQPRIDTVAPSALGQGASAIATDLNGVGFNPTSTVFVGAPTGNAAATDVTLGGATSSATKVTVPVSVASAATTGARRIGVRAADGGYFDLAGGLTVNASPKPTTINPTQMGQGAANKNVAVSGSGFAPTTTFDFGPGITAVTTSATATLAQVALTIASDALPLGARTITATNADHGTSVGSSTLNLTMKPVITKVSPPSGARGQSYAVDLDCAACVSGATLAISGTGVTTSAPTFSNGALHATFTVSPTADFGPRDLTVTNPDFGTSTDFGGFGVNSLAVLTTPVTNGANQDIVIQAAGIDKDQPITFSLPGSPDQPELTATVKSVDGPNQLTVTVPLKSNAAAAGNWSVKASGTSGIVTCTGCLQVLAATDPAGLAISPAVGGRGAVGRVITVTGTGLSHGQSATFGSGITTTDTHYVAGATPADPGTLVATISIAPDAPLGAHDVTVTNVGQPSSKGVKTGGFTVNPAPVIASIDPSALGQGAQNIDVTLTGTGFMDGSTVSFGTVDVTSVPQAGATATSLVTRVTVTPTAATVPVRTLTVTNPDGGVGTLASALTITPAPIITSIDQPVAKAGDTLTGVHFNGTGFVAETSGDPVVTTYPTVIIGNVQVTVTNVAAGGTQLTADLVVSNTAAVGKRAVRIINPDNGESTLANGFTIATVPVAPTSVAATASGTTATVTWAFPTAVGSDGGTPLTGFTVDDGDSTTPNAVTVGPAVRTADLSGLVSGKTYVFTVKANNAVGSSAAGTATAPKWATRLTSVRTPVTPVSGSIVFYSGKLTRTQSGAAVGGAVVVVRLQPDIGAARNVPVRTNGTGDWSFRLPVTYNTLVTSAFGGDSVNAAVSAPAYRMGVATKVTVTSPRSGASSSAASILAVTGSLSPVKAGRTIVLVRVVNGRRTEVARTGVASNGSYRFTLKPGRGSYVYAVTIGATPGNVAGTSPAFVVKRT